MDIVSIFEKAMLELGVDSLGLSVASGVSYHKISCLMSGDKSMKLSDLEKIVKALNLEIKFINRGKE